jgi:surfeit locus 1 family protein
MIFALIGTAVLIGLGTWQMQRLAWKEALIAERKAGLEAPPIALPDEIADGSGLNFRIVTVEGSFRHDLEQLFGAGARNGVFGHQVVTPLIRRNGETVLIDRGWIPADMADPASREAGRAEGLVSIRGLARFRRNDRPGMFTPANDPATRQWYHYDLAAMESALGLSLAPVVVEALASADSEKLPIGSRAEITLVNNHLQYAVTWYGLALALIGVYIVFHRQQTKARSRP